MCYRVGRLTSRKQFGLTKKSSVASLPTELKSTEAILADMPAANPSDDVLSSSVVPNSFRESLDDVAVMRDRLGWLVSMLRSSVGTPKMLVIAFFDVVGSIAVSIFAFGLLLVIRVMARSESFDLGPFVIDPAKKSVLLTIVVVVFTLGTIGATINFLAQRAASRAAVELATSMRRETVERLKGHQVRGWHTDLDGSVEAGFFQLIVASIREVSVAARYAVGLAGPIGIGICALCFVLYWEPVVTLIMVPFAVVNFIPALIVGRGLDEANEKIDSGTADVRESSDRSVRLIVEGETEDKGIDVVDVADRMDTLFHRRLLEPVKLQTLSVIASSALSVVAFTIFVLRAGDIRELDIFRVFVFAIALRYLVRGFREVSVTAAQVSRRAPAIDEYQRFHAGLERFERQRKLRHSHHDLPDVVRFVATDESTLTVPRGGTTLLFHKGKPSRPNAEAAMLSLERAAIVGGTPIDLLTNTRFASAEDDLVVEEYVVGTGKDEDDYVRVLMTNDPLAATIANDAEYQFIASNILQALFDKALWDEWAHLFAGVLVITDGELTACGDIAWATENIAEIRSNLVGR